MNFRISHKGKLHFDRYSWGFKTFSNTNRELLTIDQKTKNISIKEMGRPRKSQAVTKTAKIDSWAKNESNHKNFLNFPKPEKFGSVQIENAKPNLKSLTQDR